MLDFIKKKNVHFIIIIIITSWFQLLFYCYLFLLQHFFLYALLQKRIMIIYHSFSIGFIFISFLLNFYFILYLNSKMKKKKKNVLYPVFFVDFSYFLFQFLLTSFFSFFVVAQTLYDSFIFYPSYYYFSPKVHF